MLDAGDGPKSIPIDRRDVFHGLVDTLAVSLDVSPFGIVTFGQIGGVDVGHASELQHLDQSPRIVLRLKHEESWFDEFVEISRLEALHLGRVFLDTLLEWDLGLCEDQFVSFDGVVDQCLIVVDIGKIEDHGSAIRCNQYSLFIVGVLIDEVTPNKGGNCTSRCASDGDICRIEKAKLFIQVCKMGQGVIASSEVQTAIFVLNGVQFGPDVQRAIAIWHEDSIPGMKGIQC